MKATIFIVAFVALAAATPQPKPPNIRASIDDAGTTIELSQGSQVPGSIPSVSSVEGRAQAPVIEYRRVRACAGYVPDERNDTICEQAMQLCPGELPMRKVMTRIYRRPIGTNEPWEFVGQACDTAALPGEQPIPVADIEREFANTPFATPLAGVEPVDAHALVTLPVYFRATWPATGYRPGQVRTLPLLGHTVDLAIKLGHYRYDFGDGSLPATTISPGGAYPDGDIRHAYSVAGGYAASVTVTVTADYRVDGGPWQPIAGTATRTAAFPTITVLTASNRLRA